MHKIFNIIGQIWYWFRCHTYTKYHILDMRSPENGYSYGWIDRDQAMLFACFNLLVEYVEKEDGLNSVDWDAGYDSGAPKEWIDEYRHAGKEIKDLYNWWKFKRPIMYKNMEKAEPNKSLELEDTINKIDNENLLRLMKIRGYLWT